MSAATDTQVALGAGVAQRSLLEWLGRMIDRRDLSLPGPSGDARAAAIVRLLDTFSGEFAAYFEIVESARAAARRNTDSLADVVRSITQQSNHVRATAAAAVEAANATDRVAAAATALGGFAEQAAASAANADGGLAAIGGALGELGSRLDEGKSPLVQMRDSTTGVADFLVTLARLSRNAQLLAVNASIEAAHLDEAGSRFAIVAQEVRKLSVSTRESKADVARIVAELRDSTSQVAAAAKDSGDATMAAGAEIEGAGEALSETGHGIVRFEEMVATIASVAATQGTALQSVSAIVERIAQLADQAVSRSSDAGDLKLDALLERASAKIGRWTLRRQPSSPASLTTDFDRWLASLEAGAAADFRSNAEDDAELKPVCAAIRALIVRVNADQREILVDAIAVAVAVARSASPWNAIGQSLTGVNSEIGTVRATIAESTAGAHTAAGLAGEMRSLVETIRRQYSTALESLDGALARISRITASVRDIDGAVESMNAAAARADSIMALIETLSSETDLLSLNAAIEAAHAGEQGRGFSVIAEEIRSLARSTNDATVSVSELVSNITQISGNLQTSIGAAAACTGEVTSGAESVRSAITILRGAFDSAMQFALEVSTTAADQAVALERVLENINRAASALNPNANPSMERSRLELTLIGSSAHTIAARRSTGSVIEGVRAFGEALCEELEVVFESAIATGRVSHQHLFEFAYAPIAGNDIRSLARLFDVARVPATGFTPEKYATPWDPTIDEALSEVLEKHYDDRPGFTPVTIFVSDLNGFFYAYPRRKIAGWTNDYATDNAGNRIKRIFEDEYALRVGRWGLGPQADNLGSRCGYQTFVQAGCELQRATIRPWGGFVYARDTGMVYNEVALAIYANGMRHSTLRIVYDAGLL